jgi:hypothetical protein
MFGAVVVEQIGKGPGGLVRPLAPAVALPVEAVDFFGLQQRRAAIGHRESESDPLALRLGPCDLFRDHAQRRFAVFTNEKRRRMIVEGQRSQAVEDLIEEILWMDLHHHFPVDPVAHAEESIAIDSVNGGRQDRSDPRHQAAVVPIEGAARRDKRNRAPLSPAATDRPDQHVALKGRLRVADIARQDAALPVGHFGQREEEVGLGVARAELGDTALPGPEELARIAECMAQRLVRFPDVFQVSGEPVKKLQRGEFPLDRQHGRSASSRQHPSVNWE